MVALTVQTFHVSLSGIKTSQQPCSGSIIPKDSQEGGGEFGREVTFWRAVWLTVRGAVRTVNKEPFRAQVLGTAGGTV